MREDQTTISVSKDTWEELFRRKIGPKDSMESVIRRFIINDTSGYKPDIDIQSKKDLLKRIKRSFEWYERTVIDTNKRFSELTKEITEAIK